MRRAFKAVAILLLLFAAFVFFNNSVLFAPSGDSAPVLLAHRGVHQTFSREGLDGETCTADRIHPPEHGFLENTVASIAEAFRLGADVVEFDIHPTTDGRFAVFHDWTLDCRTDGTGVTREHSLPELQALDIGHGYTADGGSTYPFRGKAFGEMPSLDDVLAAFPDRRLLIDVKGNDPAEGKQLAERLGQLSAERLAQLTVYGGARPIERLRERLPALRTMSRRSLQSCLLRYLGIGWSGYVPAACRNSIVLVPINYARLLWGWPDHFLDRMRAAGTDVFVIGPWHGGSFSNGVDDEETLRRLPDGFSGGIWTNRIERIAPLVRDKR